jgi:sterol desaturase/sphingolipid hydroxylase (fatty acid hydroxylase superfamily)
VALVAILLVARVLPHAGMPAISRQPAWLQGLEILFVGDLCGYWSHRLFHTHPALWRFHAVHHSPEQLDWLAAARVHPVDTIAGRLASMLPLYLLGFSGAGLAPYALLLAVYPIYLHANVSWGYGPLRYVISSPAFHRWHHSSEKAALDKNFSGLFPIIDLLFGTAYFPHHRSARYGLYRERMPRGVIAQLRYPFRRG